MNTYEQLRLFPDNNWPGGMLTIPTTGTYTLTVITVSGRPEIFTKRFLAGDTVDTVSGYIQRIGP